MTKFKELCHWVTIKDASVKDITMGVKLKFIEGLFIGWDKQYFPIVHVYVNRFDQSKMTCHPFEVGMATSEHTCSSHTLQFDKDHYISLAENLKIGKFFIY